jgi:effector-binding domain-containing protein
MPIKKQISLIDYTDKVIETTYHVVLNTVESDGNTIITIGSYPIKGFYDWRKESHIKPPIAITMEGIDKTISDIQNYILTLPEWVDAIIVE